MSFAGLLSRMLVLLAFICIGVLCSKLRFIDERSSACINQLVLYICGPLLIIKSVQNVQFTYGIRDILMLLLYSVVLMLLALAVGIVFSRAFSAAKSPCAAFFRLLPPLATSFSWASRS